MGDETPGGPVGAGEYVVEAGECLESIAFAHGLLWEGIWSHPENADLKQARAEHNILLPGDRLFVPKAEPKSIDAVTDQRHAFRRKGCMSRLHIQIVEWLGAEGADAETGSLRPQPRPEVPYVLAIDGQLLSGQTDSDGWIDQPIRPSARRGRLILEPGTERAYETTLLVGGLDPIDAESGVCQRLANLGFLSTDASPSDSQELQDAVRDFQMANGLEASGFVDEETRAKLKSVHGS